MKRALCCILAIAWWYLLYPPVIHKGNPDSYTAPSRWIIDGTYATKADCHEAHDGDLRALQGLDQSSPDFCKPKPADASRSTIRGLQSNSSLSLGTPMIDTLAGTVWS